MKRGTTIHPKVYALASALKRDRSAAIGVLESLWHFTAQYAPAGNVGKFTDAAIAHSIGWEGDPALLVESLVACRWLDAHPQHRLAVHDWSEHCDDGVHTFLALQVECFVDGTEPRDRKLSKEQRERVAEKRAAAKRAAVPPVTPAPEGALADQWEQDLQHAETQLEGDDVPRSRRGPDVRNLPSFNKPIMPATLASDPACMAAYQEWLSHLSQKGVRLTIPMLKAQYAQLEAMGPEAATLALRESIKCGTRGTIIEPKGSKQQASTRRSGEYEEDLKL
jgi:hypothetical protein